MNKMETFQEEGVTRRIYMMTADGKTWHIGPNRFSNYITIRNTDAHTAFDFFRNFAIYTDGSMEKMRQGWAAYRKACNQYSFTKREAFHQYMSGGRIVNHGGKFSSWEK